MTAMDRVTFNGDVLDEIVVTNPESVHLEMLGHHHAYLAIRHRGRGT